MDKNEQLQQQIWEFLYELLPEDEAARVNERITSDPEVARLYAETRQKVDLLSDVAKVDAPPIPLVERAEASDREPRATAEPGQAAPGQAVSRQTAPGRTVSRRSGWAIAANWLVVTAAALLLGVALHTYLRPDSPINAVALATAEARLAREHVRLVLTGPARLEEGTVEYFDVSARSLDRSPAEVEVAYRVTTASGQPVLRGKVRTDRDGRARIALPGRIEPNSRLEVLRPLPAQSRIESNSRPKVLQPLPAQSRIESNSRPKVLQPLPAQSPVDAVYWATRLQVEPTRYATRLSIDKPLYQPGETVYYRSLTLSRYAMRPPDETPLDEITVQFELVDPGGAAVPNSQHTATIEHGVGNGAFTIPEHLPGGPFELVVRSPSELFPEARQELFIRRYRLPRLKKELEFTRDSYGPGDTVLADFAATRAEGGPVAEADLRITATLDGKTVFSTSARAGKQGAYRVKFDLPGQIEKGDGTLAVVVDDGGNSETIAKTIPINLGKVEVRFYPEGGELVAGLPNRVYFHATDPLGKPVHVEGNIVSESGGTLAGVDVETVHEGRGAFRFTPEYAEPYYLALEQPAGIAEKFRLPDATDELPAVLHASRGVFAPGEPVEVELLSKPPSVPVVIVAVCRGVQVGQRELVTEAASSGRGETMARQVVGIPLSPEVQGVLRLTVYDFSVQPAQPIAERLVYRRPARKLNVQVDGKRDAYSPGERVSLSLRVTDESGNPIAAALGVSVVDDALLNLAEDKTPQMATYYYLAGEIEKPEDLEDANFYLTDDAKAPEALDLLLGTQGWRRFAVPPLSELTKAEMAPADEDDRAPHRRQIEERVPAGTLAEVLPGGPAEAPVIVDNLDRVQESYAAALADLHGLRETALRNAGRLLWFGGIGLTVAIVVLFLTRAIASARFYVPAIGAAVASMVIGILWVGAHVDAGGQVTLTRFAPAPSASELAQALALDDVAKKDSPLPESEETLAMPMEDSPVEMAEEMAAADAGFLGMEPAAEGAGPGALMSPEAPGALAKAGLRAMQGIHERRRKEPAGFGGRDGRGFGQGRWRENGALAKNQDRFFADADRDMDDDRMARPLDEKTARLKRKSEEDKYRRTRYPIRVYAHEHRPGPPGFRTDFAETLFWHPLLLTGRKGLAPVRFDLSDSVTTFRVQVDAHAAGRIGTANDSIVSRIPFSLEPKLPLEVTAGDRIDLPLAVNNDTHDELPVTVTFEHDVLLTLNGPARRDMTLEAGRRHREYFTLDVTGNNGSSTLQFRGQAGNLADGVKKPVRIVPRGFPIERSFAGQLAGTHTVDVELPAAWTDGSLEVTLEAFPSTLSDLQKGVDGILREPSGCFEQTSSSNYPNVMALQFMQSNDVADPDFTRRAKELLEKGYARLIGFECSTKGYEWFGGDPGHEALTAYGLLEFHDMAQVWDVDPRMVERTAQWLLARRDGKGRFTRNARALDSFGRASADVTDAYIVWALTAVGQEGIEAEVQCVADLARKSDDPYLIALAALSAAATDKADVRKQLLDRLTEYQKDDGHLEPVDGTITRSGGLSGNMETTALAAMAWMTGSTFAPRTAKAVEWIVAHRQGSGSFGSTQATVLALKALAEYSKAHRKAVVEGELIVRLGGNEIARTSFEAGRQRAVTVERLAGLLQPGTNRLALELTGGNQMPFALSVRYRADQPASTPDAAVRLATHLATEKVAAGQPVTMTVELENVSGKGQPMTVAIVGVPAGLEPRVDKLEALKELGRFDYFELAGREIVLYWRSLAPECKGDKKIRLDLELIAEIPGRYTSPASRAYLYYTPELKHWTAPTTVEITRP